MLTKLVLSKFRFDFLNSLKKEDTSRQSRNFDWRDPYKAFNAAVNHYKTFKVSFDHYKKKKVFVNGDFDINDFKPSQKDNSAIYNEYDNVWKPLKTEDPKYEWRGLNKSPVY